jgi:LPS-assembly protein
MDFYRTSLALILGSACFWTWTATAEDQPIEITADGNNRFEAGIAYASGNVIVRYKGDILYADEMAYDSKTKEVTARGNVRIYTGNALYRGDQIVYNFDNRRVVSQHFYIAGDRFLAKGSEVFSPANDVYVIKNGIVTTDNRDKPGYRVEAGTIEIYQDDRVVVKNAVIYAGPVPVMWIPYVAQSLDSNRSTYEVDIGSSSRWGAYILNTYNWQVNPRLATAVHFDYRDKRGFGGGIDFDYTSQAKPGSRSQFRSFYTHDTGNDIGVGSPDRPIEPENRRFRFSYKHSLELAPDFYSVADLNAFSDRHITEDYFEKEFRREREPDNVVDLMYYNQNFTSTLLTRKQINGLYEVAERLPEFNIEIKRQQIPGTPLTYEGESSVVNFRREFDRDSGLVEYESVRYDTFHQLLYPRQYFNWLSVTPRAGIRATQYTHSNNPADPNPNDELGRLLFHAGLEASFKVHRTWLDAQSKALGIDGIRHVAEPFINMAYQPKPNERPDKFRGYDNRVGSTRLQPINYPSLNSIDSLDELATIRHGFRNKIQTKRDGQNYDLIDWVTYGDLDLERNQHAIGNSLYSQLYNEIEFQPLPWLRFDLFSSAGLTRDSFDEVNSSLTWTVHPAVDLSIGQRYLDNSVFFPDSNLLTLGSFYRLNENWQLSQNLAFEADDGTLQEHRYSIYRDLTSWNMSFTAAFRDHRDIRDEILFYFSLTLKAFPDQSLSFSQ